jgi:beta-glucosidase
MRTTHLIASLAGLAFTALSVGCVKPGGNMTGTGGTFGNPGDSGSIGQGSAGTSGQGTGGGPGAGGAGNEVSLPGTGGQGGTGPGTAGATGAAGDSSGTAGMSGSAGTVGKMACSTPVSNYECATGKPCPGYVISASAVSSAMNAVSGMTPTQKADQLRGTPSNNNSNYTDIFRTIDSANIKGIKFRDGPRGVNLQAENPAGSQGYSTTFPVAAARGATFDVDLEYQIGQAMGDEMVASSHNLILAPTTNILRHPFWGRSQETYGEDAYLLGRLGSALVMGIQEYVPACAKHYAANNIEKGRDGGDVAVMDEQTLHEIYSRHFEMMVQDAGISCVMAAYDMLQTDQFPAKNCTENKHLLTDLLRTEFGFQGMTLSDWWAMSDHRSASADTQKTVANAGMDAGLDIEMPWSFNYSQLETQVAANAIPMASLNAAATRVVREKYRFNIATGSGLKAATTMLSAQNSITNNASHIALARQAAFEGSVLLKNDGNALPILQAGRTVNTVAVIGAKVPWSITGSGTTLSGTVDFANDVRIGDLGSSRVLPDPNSTTGMAAGMRAAAGSVNIMVSNDTSAANSADFIVVFAGLTQQDEGEDYTGASDRAAFGLDAKTGTNQQNTLIMNVAAIANANHKPMAVVLEGGAVIDTSPWASMVQAIVMSWYPGQAGGAAIGQLLFGANKQTDNFSGKLPVTWSTTGWPTFNSGTATMMSYYLGYRWFDQMAPTAPTYAFGTGLSYTTFSYSNLQVPCSTVTQDSIVNVTVDIYNTGTVFSGQETAFLFVSYDAGATAGALRSVKELKSFHRTSSLAPGAGARITFPVRVSDLVYYDATSKTMKTVTGKVNVMVGPSSDKLTLTDSFIVQ